MIYTIGHSKLEKDEFLKLAEPIEVIVDVRSHPTSRWDQFKKAELEQWLPEANIDYEFWPELGGWNNQHLYLADQMEAHLVDVRAYSNGKFPKQRIGKNNQPSDQPYWWNQGLWDYSWFMTLPEFLDGIDKLIERSKSQHLGIMCCECLWWKCHRSMIADYLCYLGEDAVHLQPKQKPHSESLGNRLERYHSNIIEIWKSRA